MPTASRKPEVTATRDVGAPTRLATTPGVLQRHAPKALVEDIARRPPVILFVAANPRSSAALRLPEECAEIQRELKMSLYRDDFHFVSCWAAGVDDLMRLLAEFDPAVIHFSGHGDSTGLLLQDEQGEPQPVQGGALAWMIAAAAPNARVVVLNACYTAEQADQLRHGIDCVVSVDGAIGDDAARAFARWFYGALGNRRSIGSAVDHGIAAIIAKQLSNDILPRCLTRESLDAYQIFVGGGKYPPDQTVEHLNSKQPNHGGTQHRVNASTMRRRRNSLSRTLCMLVTAITIPCVGTVPSNDVWLAQPQGNEILWESISGGTVLLTTEGGEDNASSPRNMTVLPFYVSRNEITVEQYAQCVMQQQCPAPRDGDDCNWRKPNRLKHPINCVTWNDSSAYANWAAIREQRAVRLLTDVEFAYLAASLGRSRYPWGNDGPMCERATLAFDELCSADGTSPVCSHRVSPDLLVCDLIGNVWEWTQSSLPTSIAGRSMMILRGGGWSTGHMEIDTGIRDWRNPFFSSPTVGFRVAYSD